MKPKYRRLRFLFLSLLAMGLGLAGILYAFSDNLVFFYTPTQLLEKQHMAGFDASRQLRIGGLVKAGSIHSLQGGGVRFTVTDLHKEIRVLYRGLLPSLFREGQGVVAQGALQQDGSIVATTILAKHEETYMPREVVEALKKSGKWQGAK
jgi:cytochrome c-type biogenesis protein CcmE